MRLKTGSPAPPFEVVDTTGRIRRLEDYRGKRLLLSFYRYAACPYCNLRIHRLEQCYDDLAAEGLNVLAFFQSDSDRVDRIVGEQLPPFPLVGEPERAVYGRYGVESSTLGFLAGLVKPTAIVALSKGFLPGKMEGDKRLLPADFLIGPDLRIADAFYAKDISQHMPLSRIRAFLAGGRGARAQAAPVHHLEGASPAVSAF